METQQNQEENSNWTPIQNHGVILNDRFLSNTYTLIGLGHGLSRVGLELIKLGADMVYVMDQDKVEERNILGTLYQHNQLNTFKAESYAQILFRQSNQRPIVIALPFHATTKTPLPPSQWYISALDSGNARIEVLKAILQAKKTYSRLYKEDYPSPYYMDIRFNFSQFFGYVINTGNPKALRFLKDDTDELKDIEDEHGCNARSNPIAMSLCAGLANRVILDVTSGVLNRDIITFSGNADTMKVTVFG